MRTGARTAAAALFVAPLALVVFRGGGSQPTELLLAGTFALVAAAALAAAAAFGRLPAPALERPGLALVAAASGFVLWGGLTTAWSIAPDRSWSWLNRGLVYVAFLVLGVIAAAAIPLAASFLASALAGIAGAALAWALAGKVVPALGPDVDRSARLREPIGYWNALALLLAIGIPLALRLASDRGRSAALRAVATAGIGAAVVGVVLTASRGGLLVAVVATAIWFALARERAEGAVALAAALPPAVVAAGVGLALPGVSEAGASLDERRAHGAVFGLVLVAALAASFGIAYVLARRDSVPVVRPRVLAFAGVVLLALVVAVSAARASSSLVGSHVCNPPEEQVTQDVGRILETSFNNRCTWWREAWRLFVDDPIGGTGAASFELARRPLREDTQHPLSPHDLPVQALAETGIVGFSLLAAFVAAAVWTLFLALRRAGDERPAVVALVVGCCAWAAHSLVDMGWEYPAVTAPVFAALGVLAVTSAGERRATRLGPLAAVGVVAVAAVSVSSLAMPWLAEERLDDAAAAVVDGDVDGAAEAAADARSLNPFSVGPLFFEAALAEARGRPDEALSALRDAVDVQPENPETWYQLARHYFEARRDPATAFCALDRAYAIDSWDAGTNDLLKEVRAELDGRDPRCRFA
jgi:O-antigen ligase